MNKNKLGYKRNSPYKNEPFIDINGNRITMSEVDHPILAISNGDKPRMMYPNEEHLFPNSTKVREIPIKNKTMQKTFQKGGYVVKKGDSLSKIAKDNNVSLEDLIKLNGIKNPNSIKVGQQLNLSNTPTTSTASDVPNTKTSSYKVSKGDSLGLIAKKNNISIKDLAAYNNIKDINKIAVGQEIKIPVQGTKFSNKELIKEFKKTKPNPQIDTEKLYQGFDESQINNEQVVINNLKGKEPFVLIDKKTNTLKRYDAEGKEIANFRVGLGSEKGDKYTVNSKNKKLDRNTTPAGIYTVDTKGPNESYAHDYDNNILLLKNQNNIRQATSIHQLPKSLEKKRSSLLNNTNLTDDDFSNGCINCNREQYEQYLKEIQAGQKVVILPEEEGNYFTVKNGELAYTTNKNKQYGQYNYTPRSNKTTDFNFNVKNPTDYQKKFIDALKNEKSKLTKDLNLSDDEYNELAKRAYSIFGQESSFGEGSYNPAHNYILEDIYSQVFDSNETRQGRSLGLTQIRPKNINPEFAKKYDIDNKTLFYPYQSAVATMERLADAYQAVKQPNVRSQYKEMTPDNVYDYAVSFYNKPVTTRSGKASGKNTYVQNVNKYATQNVEYSKSNPKFSMAKMKKGGKLDHTKALQAYLESLPESEQDQFVDYYESLADNERDDLVTQMVMRDGGMYQNGGDTKDKKNDNVHPAVELIRYADKLTPPDAPKVPRALKALKKMAPIVGPYSALIDVANGNNMRAVSEVVPLLGELLDYVAPNWDSPEHNQRMNEVFGSVPKAFNTAKNEITKTFSKYQQGGNIPTYPQMPGNQLVEVEGKETVKLPNGELNKFEGPSHAQGGIPTNLPEGSKVFSHYLKPDVNIVETVLGKKAKPGLSYADLSKKFPTKKWENILSNPDADEFKKNTAQVKLEKSKAMLETIFQAQELDKGVNTDQQYMQNGGEKDLTRPKTRLQSPLQLDRENANIQDYQNNPYLNKYLTEDIDGQPALHYTEENRLLPIEGDTYINTRNSPSGKGTIAIRKPGSQYIIRDVGKGPEVIYFNNYDILRPKEAMFGANNTVTEPDKTRVQINPKPILPIRDNKSPIGPGIITWDFSDVSNRFQDLGNGSYFDPVQYGKVDRNLDGTYIVQQGPFKGKVLPAPQPSPTIPNKIRPKGKGKNPISPTAPVQDAEPISIPLPIDMLNNPVSNRTVASMNTSNPQPTPINPVTQQQVKTKDKGAGFDFGIDSKLAGTILDIGLALSDNINVRNPTYYDNQTYPLFNRFVEFDNKEAGRQASLAIQQIQNSNLPEQVKQAQIANITAQSQDKENSVNFANQQRYENKLDADTNKLQSYLDRNVGVRNQDFDSYLQRKSRVDDLYAQFKAQQKGRVVNSGIDYLNYVDDTNKKNILTSDNYRYNPVTGKIRFKESQKDPLKDQEALINQYQQNSKNAIQLNNGASMTMINSNTAIVVGADGKATVVDLSKGK
jgi:LysM repeat protein